jgi:hypothetical protein
MGEIRNAYKILIGTSEGKRTFGRSRLYARIILKWILCNLGGMWIGFF